MKKFLDLDFRKLDPRNAGSRDRSPGTSVLGLTFDGSRLEGVELRRTNGSVEIRKSFAVSLSLDLLTAEPELAGRELRKHLDAAGVRERRCAVCLPLSWALTLNTKVPDLPEADQESFLQIEAERGFPYGPDALLMAHSRLNSPGGGKLATLVAIPRDPVARLEAVLAAAQLRPASFSLGVTALQRPEAEASNGVIALVPGENNLSLQITCGGGVVVLRTIEHAFEPEGGERRFQADHVLRELRITLGQLPPDVRETMKRLRVFGAGDAVEEIVEQLSPRADALGLRVEQVKAYAPDEFSVKVPPGTAVSAAMSLAVRHLSGAGAGYEFLPPKVSAWSQFASKYSSQRMVAAGATAGAVAAVILLVFFVQQVQLWYWGAKWSGMKSRVQELEEMNANIRRFRPWFDDSVRSMSILRRLTEAFPEDGAISAKTVEFRGPATVTCTGTARDTEAVLKTVEKLRGVKEISNAQIEQIRGGSPKQFTFNFQWREGGGQ